MHELTLLVVLARRVQKFLLKLQAFWRARRPKEKKKGANTKNSKELLVVALNYVEEELNGVLDTSGQKQLIQGHNKKFFKENFKPP